MSRKASFGCGSGHIAAASIIALGLAVAAQASSAPYLTMQWFGSNDGVDPVLYHMNEHSDFVTPLGGGIWNYVGSQVGSNEAWLLNWDITAHANNGGATTGTTGSSFVTADLAVTNTSGTTQSFWALVTLTLDSPILGGTLMNGQASAAVTDFLGNGATLSTIASGPFAGDPIYTGRINGVPQHTLMDSPFILNANPFDSNSVAETFGQPVPLVGPDASTISVWLKFDLTAGDTANVVGMFEVSAIPAPAALPVLAALSLLVGVRRRR